MKTFLYGQGVAFGLVVAGALVIVGLVGVATFAQDEKPGTVAGTLGQPPQPPVTLSEVEMLRLQVVALQQQVASLNGALETCRIEVAHPGFKFDPAKGLVPK